MEELVAEFRQALQDCRHLYRQSGELIVQRFPELAWKAPDAMIELMEDLHAGLLVKTYFSLALADRKWTSGERRLAQVLFEHIWQRKLSGDELRDAAYQLSGKASTLKWFSLVRPFAELAPLRQFVPAVETVVTRVANLVAKIDGEFADSEYRILMSIQQDLELHLKPLSLDATPGPVQFDPTGFAEEAQQQAATVREPAGSGPPAAQASTPAAESDPSESLPQLLESLEELIGLAHVKEEISTLTNLLRLQDQRKQQGLPETAVSLHMVFTGNPGTGKTTVARLVARLLWAMGILKRGHLIETDRSGLVAEYVGQTGPKANQCIDEALDGVLFIDEAYSLVSEGDDAFGQEAIQALLKRMEDDRDRLVVILAGYPDPMKRLLQTNPGLASRFHRTLQFEDYEPVELAQIFATLCDANHFHLGSACRARLLIAFDSMYRHRDEHFGNGRAARNVFENAVRRMANRIAGAGEITKALLTTFEPADIQFKQVSEEYLATQMEKTRFRVTCPGCDRSTLVDVDFLGKSVKCKCGKHFEIDWGKPVT
ncbi:MAG: AAA family ATPase [Planctomycetota bacterium]